MNYLWLFYTWWIRRCEEKVLWYQVILHRPMVHFHWCEHQLGHSCFGCLQFPIPNFLLVESSYEVQFQSNVQSRFAGVQYDPLGLYSVVYRSRQPLRQPMRNLSATQGYFFRQVLRHLVADVNLVWSIWNKKKKV